jgi:hypothetical protein
VKADVEKKKQQAAGSIIQSFTKDEDDLLIACVKANINVKGRLNAKKAFALFNNEAPGKHLRLCQSQQQLSSRWFQLKGRLAQGEIQKWAEAARQVKPQGEADADSEKEGDAENSDSDDVQHEKKNPVADSIPVFLAKLDAATQPAPNKSSATKEHKSDDTEPFQQPRKKIRRDEHAISFSPPPPKKSDEKKNPHPIFSGTKVYWLQITTNVSRPPTKREGKYYYELDDVDEEVPEDEVFLSPLPKRTYITAAAAKKIRESNKKKK